jgi:RNA polymerase sigma-70 factor, ECF subfamily
MSSTALIADGEASPKPRANDARRAGFSVSGPMLCQVAPRAAAARAGGRRLTASDPSTGPEVAFDALVERIARHADREAFARLFAYYAPRVKTYLLRLGLGSAQAEELSQDVMVAVWRKAGTFDRRQASAATWIFRIARNRRIDVFRRERAEMLDPDDPTFQPISDLSPGDAAETAEREAQVRRAMADLPDEQRELIRIAFYEDLSHGQIAEKTGVPLGTVKSRLRLAFAKLRLRLLADEAGQAREERR